ncbi:hypothetical protein F2P79_007582 [Pimephales promelas]|nr:hypothetical protein F2P79_007582 [Pimephales promelas]
MLNLVFNLGVTSYAAHHCQCWIAALTCNSELPIRKGTLNNTLCAAGSSDGYHVTSSSLGEPEELPCKHRTCEHRMQRRRQSILHLIRQPSRTRGQRRSAAFSQTRKLKFISPERSST